MKRMLINGTHPQELRVALVDGQEIYDLDIETTSKKKQKSNIYKGIVTRVEPSLEAAFINFGADRHGFLPIKEVAPEYYPAALNTEDNRRPSIKDVLKEGQELIVQVEKEQRGNKGAALTTYITLPGSYLVLMPNNPKAGGISRRIEGDDRAELRNALNQLSYPEEVGVIIRTAGCGRNAEELQWDLDTLLRHWEAITSASTEKAAPFLIYQESNSMMRAIRDYLHKDIDEIVIDNKDLYEQARQHIEMVRPDFTNRVKYFEGTTPLFSRFQIESQIESAFAREVRLPSGGAIIIDHSEALVSIDINSSRATSGGDIEETAFKTNLEASDEIARQLRLRDLGGLIVIDYIDMLEREHQDAVVKRIDNALNMDRARTQVGQISRFGLLEMSRQRLRPSLGDATRITCPRCTGQGTIRSTESFSLSIMRLIEENILKDNTHSLRAQLPVEVATYLLNEKRMLINDIEKRHSVSILIIPNKHMEQPDYLVERIRKTDIGEIQSSRQSFELVDAPDLDKTAELLSTERHNLEEPAVKSIPKPQAHHPTKPRTPKKETAESGVFRRVVKFLFGDEEEAVEEQKPQRHPRRNNNRQYQGKRPAGNRNQNSRRQSGGNRNNNPRHRNGNTNGNTNGNDNTNGNTNNNGNRRNYNRNRNRTPNPGNTTEGDTGNQSENRTDNRSSQNRGNASSGNRSYQNRRRRSGGGNQQRRNNSNQNRHPEQQTTQNKQPEQAAHQASSTPNLKQVETKKDSE